MSFVFVVRVTDRIRSPSTLMLICTLQSTHNRDEQMVANSSVKYDDFSTSSARRSNSSAAQIKRTFRWLHMRRLYSLSWYLWPTAKCLNTFIFIKNGHATCSSSSFDSTRRSVRTWLKLWYSVLADENGVYLLLLSVSSVSNERDVRREIAKRNFQFMTLAWRDEMRKCVDEAHWLPFFLLILIVLAFCARTRRWPNRKCFTGHSKEAISMIYWFLKKLIKFKINRPRPQRGSSHSNDEFREREREKSELFNSVCIFLSFRMVWCRVRKAFGIQLRNVIKQKLMAGEALSACYVACGSLRDHNQIQGLCHKRWILMILFTVSKMNKFDERRRVGHDERSLELRLATDLHSCADN